MRSAMAAFAVLWLSGCGTEPSSLQETRERIVQDFDWRAHVAFTEVGSTGFSGNTYGSANYRDIMSHAGRKITGYSVPTNAHETNHMLNSEVRNPTSAHDNTAYFENGKAILITEPAMHASRIRDFVPAYVKRKSGRYETYLVEQVAHWPEVLYQFDEWGAYRTDARVVAELDAAGTLAAGVNNEICIADGAIEFLYFATAAVRGLQVDEPTYLSQNSQFKAAFAMLAEQTMEYFAVGRGRQVFDCDGSEYLEHFQTSPENVGNRQALVDWFGGVWTQRVLGF